MPSKIARNLPEIPRGCRVLWRTPLEVARPHEGLYTAAMAFFRSLPRPLCVAAILCGLALFLPGCQPEGPKPATPAKGNGALHLGLVYTGNVLGTIDPCGCVKNQLGGLARRATLMDRLRDESASSHVLYVDYGNLLFPLGGLREIERDQLVAKARLLVTAQAKMGMAAYTPGGNDLSGGFGTFQEIFSGIGVPVVSANLFDPRTGEPLVPPSVVLDVGGVAIGVTGVSEPFVPKDSVLAEEVQVRDPFTSLEPVLADLRAKTQRILILSRLRLEDRQKLARLPGVDFVIGSQRAINTAAAWAEGEALLSDVSDRGQQLGTLLVELFPGRRGYVSSGELTHWRNDLDQVRQARAQAQERGADLAAAFDERAASLQSKLNEAERQNPYRPAVLDVTQEIPEQHEHSLLVDSFRQRQETSAKALYGDPWEGFLKGKSRYGGDQSCRACHLPQHDFWSKTGHSNAFASLEKTHQGADQACLKCHTTAMTIDWTPKGGWAPPFFRNVQCEACHGGAAAHAAEPLQIKPVWIPGKNVCVQCHGIQHGENFDFEKGLRKSACPVTSGRPSKIPELIRNADNVAPKQIRREE